MFRHGEFSTECDRKPFFFTLAALAGSLTAAVLLFVLGGGEGLAIFAGVLCAIVGAAAALVMTAMVTDRAYVENGVLTMGYFFKKTQIRLKEIGKVSLKDDVYSVFNRKGELAGTINGKLTGIGEVLHAMDKNGVPFV
jgi:hypothetical protein